MNDFKHTKNLHTTRVKTPLEREPNAYFDTLAQRIKQNIHQTSTTTLNDHNVSFNVNDDAHTPSILLPKIKLPYTPPPTNYFTDNIKRIQNNNNAISFKNKKTKITFLSAIYSTKKISAIAAVFICVLTLTILWKYNFNNQNIQIAKYSLTECQQQLASLNEQTLEQFINEDDSVENEDDNQYYTKNYKEVANVFTSLYNSNE